MQHNFDVKMQGRFRVEVHDGHTYDADGKLLELAVPKQASGKGFNKVTLKGFENLLKNYVNTIVMVAGDGNAAPLETDTTLSSYLGKTSTHVSTTTTRSTTPDIDGYVYIRTEFRFTFNPGVFGAAPVNISEGGIVLNIDSSSVAAGSEVSARGLLDDGAGSPVSVSVSPLEYLDMIWEITEYVKASATGSVTITLPVSGATSHAYEVRPCQFGNTGGSGGTLFSWASHFGGILNGYSSATSPANTGYEQFSTHVFDSPLADFVSGSLGAYNANMTPDAVNPETFMTGTKSRKTTYVWTKSRGNIGSGEVSAVRFYQGFWCWQISYDPPLPKAGDYQMNLDVTLTLGNK